MFEHNHKDTMKAQSSKSVAKGKSSFKKATVACNGCRKSKTRCYPLSDNSCCLRCKNLSLPCSISGLTVIDQSSKYNKTFLKTGGKEIGVKYTEGARESSINETGDHDTLAKIEVELKSLSKRMTSLISKRTETSISTVTSSSQGVTEYNQSKLDSLYFNISPFRDVTAVSSATGLKFNREIGYDIEVDEFTAKEHLKFNLFHNGLLDYNTCLSLLDIFKTKYSEWASIPSHIEASDLLAIINEDSPFLLSVCCLIASRYFPKNSFVSKWIVDVLETVNRLLSLSVNMIPQSKHFLQGILLLSSHSLSLSYKKFYFDGWQLSGYGLINFITREMNLNLLSDRFKSHPDRINSFRIWNHLSLTHLWFCILTGRPCLIDEVRLDQCREILELPLATSYDGKSVAELAILLSLYNCLQYEESFSVSEKDLRFTFSSWDYLCEQQKVGNLIKITYKFAKIMLYRRDLLRLIDAEDDNHRLDLSVNLSWNQTAKTQANETMIPIVCNIIEEVGNLMKVVTMSDRDELYKCSDALIFSIPFTVLTATKASRLSPLPESLLQILNESVDACVRFCTDMSATVNYYNAFLDHYCELLLHFQRS